MHFKYIQPKNLMEASQFAAVGWDKRGLYAGGTDLLGLLKHDIESPEELINLKMIPDLDIIKYRQGRNLEIGALVKIAEIAGNKQITKSYPALAEAAQQVASPQLRNVGTIGGNLCQRPRCWYYRGDFDCLRKGGDECFAVGGENKYHCVIGGGPCFIVSPSDTAVALSALNAKIEIYLDGNTRQIPISNFFVLPEDDLFRENILKPGEIITKIIVPESTTKTQSTFRKARVRDSWDFATVSVAIALSMDGNKINEANIVLGGVAPKPWKEDSVETLLRGKILNESTINMAISAALADAEPMEQNGYKLILAKNMIKEVLQSFSK